MAESWHAVVDDELSRVDDVMRMEVRSAYPELNRMCEDTLGSRYHSVRPALCILSYYANGGKDSDIAVNTASCFESVFEGLHLHDLVNNDGEITGVKKKLFSKAPSTTKIIVAGDFMYVMGFRLAYGKVPKVVPYLMQASASISDAIFKITDNLHNADISEELCLEVLKGKGAIEYQIIMECAAKQAGVPDEMLSDMRECGMYIGMALQLESDLEDIFDEKAAMITFQTGYPTLPIFYSIQDSSNGKKIRELFSEGSDCKEVQDLIRKTDAMERCKGLIKDCSSKALSIAERLPESVYKESLIAFIRSIQ